MKIANKILKKILTDRVFRLNVSIDAGISEEALKRAADRAKKGGQSLTKLKTLNALSKHSNLTIEEIVSN